MLRGVLGWGEFWEDKCEHGARLYRFDLVLEEVVGRKWNSNKVRKQQMSLYRVRLLLCRLFVMRPGGLFVYYEASLRGPGALGAGIGKLEMPGFDFFRKEGGCSCNEKPPAIKSIRESGEIETFG
jgi:hypothetical protein